MSCIRKEVRSLSRTYWWFHAHEKIHFIHFTFHNCTCTFPKCKSNPFRVFHACAVKNFLIMSFAHSHTPRGENSIAIIMKCPLIIIIYLHCGQRRFIQAFNILHISCGGQPCYNFHFSTLRHCRNQFKLPQCDYKWRERKKK